MTPLLSCQSLRKAFSGHPLFQDISLGIGPNERIGLIGANGSGKSTFLKILAGLEPPDGGTVSRQKGLRVGTVAQENPFAPELTVVETLHAALQNEPMDDHEKTTQINIILNRVGFPDGEQVVRTLSGGWRKRLALACELIRQPDLLLLDEPTNHLDLQGILWLENLLKTAPFACLLVSHDRAFLESVVNRMIEFSRAYAEGYLSVNGTYTDLLIKREEYLNAQAAQQRALETQVKREIEWLRRGPQARTTKAKFRIEEAGRMMEELREVTTRNAQGRTADIDFSATERQTRALLVARDLSIARGGRTLFSGLSFTLSPGVKLGLLGANGSGKTTLLKLLSGELEPDAGRVVRAEGLRVVVFDQNREQLNKTLSLRQTLAPESDYVYYQGSPIHVASWAKRFLFRTEQLEMPVGALSGGEQARLLVARLMLRPADLLILDEPTNDLDIPTLEVLEESLQEFPGALVLVTHDRYMLDTLSTNLLALDGQGGFGFFADYSQWERTQAPPPAPLEPRAKTAPAAPKPSPSAARRLTTAEQRELRQMEETILAAEEEVARLQAALSAPEVFSDYQKMQTCLQDLEAAQARVTRLYTRWEELESRV